MNRQKKKKLKDEIKFDRKCIFKLTIEKKKCENNFCINLSDLLFNYKFSL